MTQFGGSMGKKFKKLKGFLKETWSKLDKQTTVRHNPWKISETPVTDMKQTAAEGTLNRNNHGGAMATTKSDNRKEIDNNDHEKKEEHMSDWKAELLKFKAEAEEFNVELEKAMIRRRQSMTTI